MDGCTEWQSHRGADHRHRHRREMDVDVDVIRDANIPEMKIASLKMKDDGSDIARSPPLPCHAMPCHKPKLKSNLVWHEICQIHPNPIPSNRPPCPFWLDDEKDKILLQN